MSGAARAPASRGHRHAARVAGAGLAALCAIAFGCPASAQDAPGDEDEFYRRAEAERVAAPAEPAGPSGPRPGWWLFGQADFYPQAGGSDVFGDPDHMPVGGRATIGVHLTRPEHGLRLYGEAGFSALVASLTNSDIAFADVPNAESGSIAPSSRAKLETDLVRLALGAAFGLDLAPGGPLVAHAGLGLGVGIQFTDLDWGRGSPALHTSAAADSPCLLLEAGVGVGWRLGGFLVSLDLAGGWSVADEPAIEAWLRLSFGIGLRF